MKFLKFLLNSCECDYEKTTDNFNYDKFTDILHMCFHNKNENLLESQVKRPLTDNIFLAKKADFLQKDQMIIDLLKSKLILDKAEKIEKIFLLVDINKDNFLDQNEFNKMIKIIDENIPFTDILSLFNYFDINKDGRISLLEFFKTFDIESQELEKYKINKIQMEALEKDIFKPIIQNILKF